MNQKSILIIEQEESAINLLKAFLSKEFQLLFVPSSVRALNILFEEKIDLVILSRCLHDGNSLEILQKIREKFSRLPIVFIAEAPGQKYIISAFRLGANDFFVKPLQESDFKNRLYQQLETPERFPLLSNGKRKATHRLYRTLENHEIAQSVKFSGWNLLTSFFSRFKMSQSDFQSKIYCSKDENVGKQTSKSVLLESSANTTSKSNLKEDVNFKETGSSEVEKKPILFLNFFGDFQVILNHHEIDEWPGRKTEDVFACLAYNHNRRIHRDVLMDRFWPNSTPDSARNCLNVTLHSIRKTFEKVDPSRDYIKYKNECYFLNPEIELKIDVEEFLLFWKLAQSTERENGIDAALGKYELAAAVYKGDFMGESFSGPWADLDRENLKEIYMEILNKLSDYYSLDGKPDVAIDLCDLILKKDNCREDVHRRLMRCFYRVGQRDKAIRQYNKCAEILQSELTLLPSKATLELYEKIRKNQ